MNVHRNESDLEDDLSDMDILAADPVERANFEKAIKRADAGQFIEVAFEDL